MIVVPFQRFVLFLKPSPEWGPSDPDVQEVNSKSYNITSAAHMNPTFTNDDR